MGQVPRQVDGPLLGLVEELTKLIASIIARNELSRYLLPCIESLLGFVDEIRILDDGSDDGSAEALLAMQELGQPVLVKQHAESTFFAHEGIARQALLDWTMEGNPSHVLAIDADEFVDDPERIVEAVATGGDKGIWHLEMQEIWEAGEDNILIRVDNLWRPRKVPILYTVPDYRTQRNIRRHFRIMDKALACPRLPIEVIQRSNRGPTGTAGSVLHFGWACERDRAARYARYVEHDGGKHHDGKHLESIMWLDDRVKLQSRAWPAIDKRSILDHCDDSGVPA